MTDQPKKVNIPAYIATGRTHHSCTWEGCGCKASHLHFNKSGEAWANLCFSHHMALTMNIKRGGQSFLRAWVRAQGGSAKVAEKINAQKVEEKPSQENEQPVAVDAVAKSVITD